MTLAPLVRLTAAEALSRLQAADPDDVAWLTVLDDLALHGLLCLDPACSEDRPCAAFRAEERLTAHLDAGACPVCDYGVVVCPTFREAGS